MRGIGALHPTEGITVPSDVVAVIAGSSAGAVMTNDYPSATSATGSSRPHIMLISAQVPIFFRDGSTAAAIPATNGTTPGSTAHGGAFISQSAMYQVPGGSTGYSIAFPTTGFVTIEFFRKGGDST